VGAKQPEQGCMHLLAVVALRVVLKEGPGASLHSVPHRSGASLLRHRRSNDRHDWQPLQIPHPSRLLAVAVPKAEERAALVSTVLAMKGSTASGPHARADQSKVHPPATACAGRGSGS